jgi:hypothetical protein
VGKIIASYLLKVHLHADDDDAEVTAPTNDVVKEAAIAGLQTELEVDEVTVSLIERTDD